MPRGLGIHIYRYISVSLSRRAMSFTTYSSWITFKVGAAVAINFDEPGEIPTSKLLLTVFSMTRVVNVGTPLREVFKGARLGLNEAVVGMRTQYTAVEESAQEKLETAKAHSEAMLLNVGSEKRTKGP